MPADQIPVPSARASGGPAPARTLRATPGSLVARLAGGALVLVVVGTIAAGSAMSSRTARSFANARTDAARALRPPVAARLRALTHDLVAEVSRAEAEDDWSALQAELPRRAAADPGLGLLLITDDDGLVVADADPTRNGRPVTVEAVRALIRHAVEGSLPAPTEALVDGIPLLLWAERRTGSDGAPRVVVAGASLAPERAVDDALAAEAQAALRIGWVLVVLGGLVFAVVAVGVVAVVGGAIARRLHVVAWRISELGRGDRGTHVRLGGPAELEHVEQALERAAQRLASERSAEGNRRAAEAERAAVLALVEHGEVDERSVGPLRVSLIRDRDAHSAVASLVLPRPDGTTLFALVEVLSAGLVEGALAAELRGAASLLGADSALGASALLARLDTFVGAHRARAIIAVARAGAVTLANAGGRFPQHRRGEGRIPVVVRGDRLGEPGARRGPEVTVELAAGEALELEGELGPVGDAGETARPSLRLTIARAA